jgi:fibronectin type 3 domain-containing protein
MTQITLRALLAACALTLSSGAGAADSWHFEFGDGKAAAGYIAVKANTEYSTALGYGFEPGANARTVEDASSAGAYSSHLTADKPFFFSADLPEGNYTVTIKFGASAAASSTTIKAELRRLMLENVTTAPGATVTRSFTVNVRTPRIPAGAGLAAGGGNHKTPRE